jgi:hypothetical protein
MCVVLNLMSVWTMLWLCSAQPPNKFLFLVDIMWAKLAFLKHLVEVSTLIPELESFRPCITALIYTTCYWTNLNKEMAAHLMIDFSSHLPHTWKLYKHEYFFNLVPIKSLFLNLLWTKHEETTTWKHVHWGKSAINSTGCSCIYIYMQ